jgi:hypothetical protein
MKKSIYSQLVCLIIALGLGLGIAQAQESNVEIVTTYTPEIASATKLLAPTSIADDPRIDPDIAYQVTPSLWQISLDAHNFNPARASYWDYISYKRLFVKVIKCYNSRDSTDKLGNKSKLYDIVRKNILKNALSFSFYLLLDLA